MLLYFGHCCGVLGYCYVQLAHPVPPMVVQLAVYVKRLAAAVQLFVWLFVVRGCVLARATLVSAVGRECLL